MTTIKPPLAKGERRQPQQTIKVYRATVETLDDLVLLKNTTRVEYLRWLVDCAEAGLVGPTPGVELEQEISDVVTVLIAGPMTHSEGVAAMERLINRACREQRAHSEREWSGTNDTD